MATVHVNAISVQPDGSVFLDYDWTDNNGTTQGGLGATWPSIAELNEAVRLSLEGQDSSRLIAMAWILARSPDLTNVAQIEGKNVTIDFGAPAPIRVQ